jgi:hypothetical protein
MTMQKVYYIGILLQDTMGIRWSRVEWDEYGYVTTKELGVTGLSCSKVVLESRGLPKDLVEAMLLEGSFTGVWERPTSPWQKHRPVSK